MELQLGDLFQKQKIKGSLWNLCVVYAGKTSILNLLRPAYTAHKFQRLSLIFCFWNKSPNCFVLEFQKQVPETFAVYAGL